jgi:hypothetical protein
MTNYQFDLDSGAVMFVNGDGLVTREGGQMTPPSTVVVGDRVLPFVGDVAAAVTSITTTEV